MLKVTYHKAGEPCGNNIGSDVVHKSCVKADSEDRGFVYFSEWSIALCEKFGDSFYVHIDGWLHTFYNDWYNDQPYGLSFIDYVQRLGIIEEISDVDN